MGKVWLISGAGSGFGRELAQAATGAGDVVVATGRSPESVQDFPCHTELDVTQPDSVLRAVEFTLARYGRIDVLVNNAGHGLLGAVEELSDDDLLGLLQTNVFGALRLTRAVLPSMRAHGGGHVVQMSSVGGIVGNPGHAAYATSKFALEGMSEALAGEVAGFGIKVLIVEPGPFRTDFAGRSIHYAQPLAAYDETPAGWLRARFVDQDQRQPNDPRRAAQIILRALDDPEPPLRLPLGPEAIERIREKLRIQCADIDRWEPLARDTRYLDE